MNTLRKGALAFVTLASVGVLAACQSQQPQQAQPAPVQKTEITSEGSKDVTNIVSYEGGKITSSDLFNYLKKQPQTGQALYNLVVFDVFAKAYGEEVKQSEVDRVYEDYRGDLEGTTWLNELAKNGFDEESFKAHIRKQLAYERGVKSQIQVSNNELEELWKTYQPDMDIKILGVREEAKANEIKEKLDKGEDFNTLAKENSALGNASQGGAYTLSYDDPDIPENVKAEAYKLVDNQNSGVIKYDLPSGKSYYYIVRMVRKVDKGDDYTKYRDELRADIIDLKFQDSYVVNSIIKAELEKVNFKLEDAEFEATFNDIMVAKSATVNQKEEETTTKTPSTTVAETTAAETTTQKAQ